MTFTLDYFPLGIVYAIWSALGIAVVAIMSYFLYSQSLQWQAIVGLVLVIFGVILINFYTSPTDNNLESEDTKSRDTFMEMSDLNK